MEERGHRVTEPLEGKMTETSGFEPICTRLKRIANSGPVT